MTTRIKSQSGGNGLWSSGGNWVGGVAPVAGQSVQVTHAIQVDVNVDVGASPDIAVAGTGTVGTGGVSSQTVVGTGTSFLSQLSPGDLVTAGGSGTRTVQTVTDDTHFTVNAFFTIANGTSFTIRQCALYVKGTTATTVLLSFAAGKVMTARGDVNLQKTKVTFGAGAKIQYDNSSNANLPMYFLNQTCGEDNAQISEITPTGTAGSHCYIGGVSATSMAAIVDRGGGSAINAAYTDFFNLGSVTQNAIGFAANVSGRGSSFDHCRFSNCWRMATATMTSSSSVSWTNNELMDLPATAPSPTYAWLQVVNQNTTTASTGTRLMTDNVFALPDRNVEIDITQNSSNWTIRDNVFNRINVGGGGTTTPTLLNKNNLIYYRVGAATADWCFYGAAGDLLDEFYVVNDEGPAQANEHQVMANDNPSVTGEWKYRNPVFDRPGPAGTAHHITHAPSPGATVPFTVTCEGLLSLPMGTGTSPGAITGRGQGHQPGQDGGLTGKDTTYRVRKSTLVNDYFGGTLFGSSYAGHTGMVDEDWGNLSWGKATPGASSGFAVVYNATSNQCNDLCNLPQTGWHAHYNSATGNLKDTAGTNQLTLLGYDGLRLTDYVGFRTAMLARDLDLGTGTDETTQGPKFYDNTRYFATADRALFGNTGVGIAAWADAHNYAVGDIVKAATVGWYNNLDINYRCVKAHLSNAADTTTNGKPSHLTTSYRTNWEFATAFTIREAVKAGTTYSDPVLGVSGVKPIKYLHAWNRLGWKPRADSLRAMFVTNSAPAGLLVFGNTPGAIEAMQAGTGTAGTPTSSTIDVTWTAPTNAQGTVTAAVQYKRHVDSSWTTFASGLSAAQATPYTITGLANSTLYDTRVLHTDQISDTVTTPVAQSTTTSGAAPTISVASTRATSFRQAPGSVSIPGTSSYDITNTGTGTLDNLSGSISYGSGSGWLAVSFSNGAVAPCTMTLTPSPGALTPGSVYTATVTIHSSASGITNDGAIVLNVTFNKLSSFQFRYKPRYTLPNKFNAAGAIIGTLSIDPTYGYVTDEPFPTARLAADVVDHIADTGNPATNAQNIIDKLTFYKDDTRNIRLTLDGNRANYGRGVTFPSSRGVGHGWIEIAAASDARPEGTRIQRFDASQMPMFGVNNANQATDTGPTFSSRAFVMSGTDKIRIVGVDVTFDPGFTPYAWDDAAAGSNTNTRGLIDAGYTGPTVSWIIFDRCLIHGTLGKVLNRGMMMAGNFLAVVDCDIYDAGGWFVSGDPQGLAVSQGSGPYLLKNTRFECILGEACAFVLGPLSDVSVVPQDILIKGCCFNESPSWDALRPGQPIAKNLLEFKGGQRAVVQGNIFQHYFGGYNGQKYAVNTKSNYDNTITSDIHYIWNLFLDCDGSFNSADANVIAGQVAPSRIEQANNISILPSADAGILGKIGLYGSRTGVDDTDALRKQQISIHHNTTFSDANHFPIEADVIPLRKDQEFVESNIFAFNGTPAQPHRYFRNSNSSATGNTRLVETNIYNIDPHGSFIGYNGIVSPGLNTSLIPTTDTAWATIAALGLTVAGAPVDGSAALLTADCDGGRIGATSEIVTTLTANALNGGATGGGGGPAFPHFYRRRRVGAGEILR